MNRNLLGGFRPSTTRTANVAGFTTFAFVAAAFFAWVGLRFGLNSPPSTSGDEPSYDSIAWELSQGDGYAIDYSDSDFRSPYDAAAKTEPELFALPQTTEGPVAFRPPLMPTLNAGANLLLGRQFYFLRSLNILLIAATAGLMAAYVCRTCGVFAVFASVVLFLTDVRTRLYARALLTEPIACLLTATLALLLFRMVRKCGRFELPIVGLVVGLSILTRSIAVLWLPGLMLTIFFIQRRAQGQSFRASIFRVCIFFCFVLLTISPWAIRNVVLLERFAPLGTQGLMELSAGYSDVAWEHHGVWQNLASSDFFAELDLSQKAGVEKELVIADASRTKAIEWVKTNTMKVPAMAAMKVYNEFRPYTAIEAIVLTFAFIGAFATRRSPATLIMVGLLLTNALAVAATWSVEGRFVVPLLFVIYSLCGIGVAKCFGRFSNFQPSPSPNS